MEFGAISEAAEPASRFDTMKAFTQACARLVLSQFVCLYLGIVHSKAEEDLVMSWQSWIRNQGHQQLALARSPYREALRAVPSADRHHQQFAYMGLSWAAFNPRVIL
jgi:hypothetical protein